MNIIIGSDHAGFDLKEEVTTFLSEKHGFRVVDMGTDSNTPVDYPIVAHKVAGRISNGEFNRGILICGSGIGMSIVANRYAKVRAALCHNLFTVKLSRLHNDANILVLGGRVLGLGLVFDMVDLFLQTEFEGGRHQRRLDEIDGSSSSEGRDQ